MNTNDAMRITPKLIVGLGILALGLLWTLDNLNIVETERLTEWWPLILIFAGMARLTNPQSSRIGSGLLIVFGTLLLLDSIDVVNVNFGALVPLGIAVIGAKIAFDALGRQSPPVVAGDDPSSTLHAFAIMAGVHRQSSAMQFRGGDANAIMGGVEFDLTNAKIPPGEEAVIDAFALWGGVEIKVPETWRVRSSVMPVMGGFDDKTRPRGEGGPMLHVRGTAIMGAIEVKN